jgi:hypothetical protein
VIAPLVVPGVIRMPAAPLSRGVRLAGRACAGILVIALVLVLAWLMSNLRDAEPAPRPQALTLQPPRIDDDKNSFYALLGLNAAAGRDPATVGRALWTSSLALAELPPEQRQQPSGQPAPAGQPGLHDAPLPSPQGVPFVCDADRIDCAAQWIAQADALEALRRVHAEFGQRCEQWALTATLFEERLPPFHGSAAPIAPHAIHASRCATWLLSGASVYWAKGRKAEAVVQLEQAARVSRALMHGSRSLVGQTIALGIARRTLETLTALALRDRAVATALAPVLARWPDQVAGVRSWMASEAAFQRGVVDELSSGCDAVAMGWDPDEAGLRARIAAPAVAWLCRHRIGWHPERIRSAIDADWMRLLALVDQGLPSAIMQFEHERAAQAGLTWINTLGQLALNHDTQHYRGYLARHADVELHREMALLALRAQQQGVPAAERSSWAASQPQSAYARGRIAWESEGMALTGRTWQAEFAPSPASSRRSAIRIAWPASTT